MYTPSTAAAGTQELVHSGNSHSITVASATRLLEFASNGAQVDGLDGPVQVSLRYPGMGISIRMAPASLEATSPKIRVLRPRSGSVIEVQSSRTHRCQSPGPCPGRPSGPNLSSGMSKRILA